MSGREASKSERARFHFHQPNFRRRQPFQPFSGTAVVFASDVILPPLLPNSAIHARMPRDALQQQRGETEIRVQLKAFAFNKFLSGGQD
jgi:hypothetical protein